MALFAETLVEEWLNRRGYFTIRGAKGGLLEMDLLAIRHRKDEPKALHVEVQASTGPISWITKWTPELQRELKIGANNARKRTDLFNEPGNLAAVSEVSGAPVGSL